MITNTLSNTNNDTRAHLNNAANKVGDAASEAYDATRTATKQIGAAVHQEASNLKADFDDLIARLPSLSTEDLAAAKQKIYDKLEAAQVSARGVAKEVREQFNNGVDVTTDYVKDRPLQSVAVATGVGILLGLLISRKQ